MKFSTSLLSLFLIFTFSFQSFAKKIALIVAVSDYEYATDLHTEKDVELITFTLKSNGFKEEYISLLKDKEVTKLNLINAIRSKLIELAEPGDIVFFHFSGHGQQVIDIDGDEADGYDESMVCSQARGIWNENNYKGEEHFLDDDLNILLTELRIKLGKKGSVLVLVDACFSGTISRSNETVRGNKYALAPKDYKPKIKPGSNQPSGIELKSGNEEMASMIVFSASKQDEFNYETQTEDGFPVGSLSYVFSKCLAKKNNISTYRSLFDLMKIQMASLVPYQTPLAEGNLETKIFSSKTKQLINYHKIDKVENGRVFIDAGKLADIHEGTIVGLYPAGTEKPNKSKRLSKAEVFKSSYFDALIKLETQLDENTIKNSWVFIEDQTYGDMRVNLYIDSNNNSWEKVKKKLEEHSLVRLIDKTRILNADIIIKDSISKNGKLLINYLVKNDKNRYVDTLENNLSETVFSSVLNEIIFFSKARYLKELDMYNPDLDIQIELLPVKKYEDRNNRYIATEFGKQKDNSTNGQIQYKEGDLFIFKVENKGSKTGYFQILNIQPDNGLSVLVPDPGTNEGDIKIEPGQTIIFASKIMQIAEPLGNDIFKVIASPEPLYNFRNIIENLKDTRGKPKSPFEFLTQDICNGTRAAKPFAVPVNTININSVVIKTVK